MSSISSSGTATPRAKPLLNPAPRTSSSLKRKLQVFIELPHSPFNSPASHKMRVNNKNSLNDQSFLLGRKIGTPLSVKMLNNGHIANAAPFTDSPPPLKKPKLAGQQAKPVKNPKKAEKDENTAEEYPNGFYYCHQCGRKRDNSCGLQCTLMKGAERCQRRYCKACLKNRYAQNVEDIMTRGNPSAMDIRAGHMPSTDYVWKCPQCSDKCNCSRCRKAKGLEPTGKFDLSGMPEDATSTKDAAGKAKEKAIKRGSSGTVDKTKQKLELMAGGSGSHSLSNRHAGSGKGKGTNTSSVKTNAKPSEEPKSKLGRPKKDVPEPKWKKVPTVLNRAQAEDRFFLREFILRFSPLMSIGAKHLEELDEFDVLSDAGAKSIIMNLLSLIAADAEPIVQKAIRDCHKRISGAGFNPSAMWTSLSQLRENLPSSSNLCIPDPFPSAVGTQRTRTANSVTQSSQLIPTLISLVECATAGASAREEIEIGVQDTKEENRKYYAAVKEENDRWAAERERLLSERAEGEKTPEWDSKKSMQKYRDAYRKHKATLFELHNAHMLKLQACAPRFRPLGSDAEGHIYYASTSYKGKTVPTKEERKKLKKWGWFLAVWGKGGKIAEEKQFKETRKDADSDMSDSDLSDEEDGDMWWGFDDHAEIKELARWIAAKEGLDMKKTSEEEGKDTKGASNTETRRSVSTSMHSKGTGADSDDELNIGGSEEHNMEEVALGVGRKRGKNELKTLVKSLNDYADFLAWRCGDNLALPDLGDDEAEKSTLGKKTGKRKTT